MRKPGALPGSVRAGPGPRRRGVHRRRTRRCGQRPAARTANPPRPARWSRSCCCTGTWHAADVIAGIPAALSVGAHAADVVAVEARKAADARAAAPAPQAAAGGAGGAAGHQPDTAPARRAARRYPAAARRQPPTTSCSRGPAPARKASHDPRTRHHRAGRRRRDRHRLPGAAAAHHPRPVHRAPPTRPSGSSSPTAGSSPSCSWPNARTATAAAPSGRSAAPGSPAPKWLADFDFDANPGISPAVINTLAGLRLGRRPATRSA